MIRNVARVMIINAPLYWVQKIEWWVMNLGLAIHCWSVKQLPDWVMSDEPRPSHSLLICQTTACWVMSDEPRPSHSLLICQTTACWVMSDEPRPSHSLLICQTTACWAYTVRVKFYSGVTQFPCDSMAFLLWMISAAIVLNNELNCNWITSPWIWITSSQNLSK